MAKGAAGYFEAWVNGRAGQTTAADRQLMVRVRAVADEVFGSCQVRWAGSQHKRTAVVGSDLDLCVETSTPVTSAQRKALRASLAKATGRSPTVHHHVVRLAGQGGQPKVDISFAKAEFGSRPLPDAGPFKGRPDRIAAVRAFKLWTRSENLPAVAGWAAEQLVVHLDQGQPKGSGLALFLRVVDWLEHKATPEAVEGILRPHAHPGWRDTWSKKLPGQVEALRNHARRLNKAEPQPSAWRSAADVERWLCR